VDQDQWYNHHAIDEARRGLNSLSSLGHGFGNIEKAVFFNGVRHDVLHIHNLLERKQTSRFVLC